MCELPEEASGAEDMVFFSSASPSLAPCFHAQCGRAQLVDEPVSCLCSPRALLPLLLQSSFSSRSLCQTTQLSFRLSLRLLVPLPGCMPPSALACVTLSQSTFSFLPHHVFMCFLSQVHLDDGATKLFSSKSSLLSASSLEHLKLPVTTWFVCFADLSKLIKIFLHLQDIFIL